MAAYCRLRSSEFISWGEAMLLISRFCSSDKFVILDLPCPGSCFGVSWARSSDMGTIAIEITYRCVYNIHRHLYMFKRLYTSDSLDIYNIYIALVQETFHMVLSRRTRGCSWTDHVEAHHRVNTLDSSLMVTIIILRWHG